jgi:hypothetical protein
MTSSSSMNYSLLRTLLRSLWRQVRRSLVPVVILLASLATSCCDARGARQDASLPSASARNAISFVRALPLPARPPSVRFEIVQGKGPSRALPGLLYASTWVASGKVWKEDPRVPVVWPEAVSFSNEIVAATMVLDAVAPPNDVEIRSYSEIDPQSGEPTSIPKAVFQCHRFTSPICSFYQARSEIRVPEINSRLLRFHYLVVFVLWGIPPNQWSEGTTEASGSWLFQVQAVA